MPHAHSQVVVGRKARQSSVLAAVMVAGLVAALPAVAQDKKAAPAPAAAPAKPAAAAPAAGQAAAGAAKSAWVKLCEKAPLISKDKDGKEVKEEKSICLTHHERLDGNTGMVLVSAAIRHVEGSEKQHLMIMVPLGMAIPPGVRTAIYTKDQWDKASKNEKIDEKALKPIDLHYSLCHPAGCTAEVEATKEMIDGMKTGGGLMVLAMNAAGQPIAFPVPLDGFGEAEAGKPVDNKEYAEARGKLMEQIRNRQAQLIEQFRKEQIEKGGPSAGAPAGVAPPAGAAPAPKK
jgi:invasion protein IalB